MKGEAFLYVCPGCSMVIARPHKIGFGGWDCAVCKRTVQPVPLAYAEISQTFRFVPRWDD